MAICHVRCCEHDIVKSYFWHKTAGWMSNSDSKVLKHTKSNLLSIFIQGTVRSLRQPHLPQKPQEVLSLCKSNPQPRPKRAASSKN